jgi:SAM-dependent methyltransferase
VDQTSTAARRQKALTRNRMGWISELLGPVSGQFVEFCATGFCGPAAPALDLGAASGAASEAAWRAGAWVIANDLDAAPLEELQRRLREACGQAEAERLRIQPGRFPRDLHFEPESLGAVHACNVFHFLTGNQLALGVGKAARWLRPGGKLFVQAATPYQAPFAAFLPEYERRIARGEKWPGWVEKIGAYSTHRLLGQMPRSIHLLDQRVLTRVCVDVGLELERAWLYRREDLPESLYFDGRESVGVVARKP